jgi:hypothetical protein
VIFGGKENVASGRLALESPLDSSVNGFGIKRKPELPRFVFELEPYFLQDSYRRDRVYLKVG